MAFLFKVANFGFGIRLIKDGGVGGVGCVGGVGWFVVFCMFVVHYVLCTM